MKRDEIKIEHQIVFIMQIKFWILFRDEDNTKQVNMKDLERYQELESMKYMKVFMSWKV